MHSQTFPNETAVPFHQARGALGLFHLDPKASASATEGIHRDPRASATGEIRRDLAEV